MKNELELRMYFFVPYNISEIQKGIQAGHVVLRYARAFSADNPEVWDFVDNHETWIILNGGTTNDQRDFDGIAEGTLNQIGDDLLNNNINFSYFSEPDLNNALTAVCFIADERVFNYDDYPEFKEYIINVNELTGMDAVKIRHEYTIDDLIGKYENLYWEWVELLGGEKNVFLRELLKYKKLA